MDELATRLGAAQRMLVMYQRECKDVLECPLAMPTTPIRAVADLIARELTWSKLASGRDLTGEIAQVIAAVEATMSLLRERDSQIERGLDRLAHDRGALLDVPPPRKRR